MRKDNKTQNISHFKRKVAVMRDTFLQEYVPFRTKNRRRTIRAALALPNRYDVQLQQLQQDGMQCSKSKTNKKRINFDKTFERFVGRVGKTRIGRYQFSNSPWTYKLSYLPMQVMSYLKTTVVFDLIETIIVGLNEFSQFTFFRFFNNNFY